jgi:hypothetical protein
MTRRAVFLLAALALPMMLIVAMAPASAAPGYGPMKCQPRKPQNTWPGNGHFWSCVSDDANQDYREVFSAANGLPGRPNMAFEVVAKLGVNLIFFYNRKQANELLVQQFRLRAAYTSDTAHCGNTYAADDPRAPIVVAVYYLCNMNGDQLAVNPNLRETTLHELGHAFDIALTRLKGPSAGPPSRSAAFRAEVQADLDHLDQSWKSDPPSQRNAYICSLTQAVAPSRLEEALGATGGPVCEETKNSGLVIRADYAGKEPSWILQKKMPYFLFPPANLKYDEAWAQDFAVFAGDDSTSENFLPFADQIFSNPAVAMGCVTNVIATFIRTAEPPPEQASQYPPGCPVEPVGKYWEG